MNEERNVYVGPLVVAAFAARPVVDDTDDTIVARRGFNQTANELLTSMHVAR